LSASSVFVYAATPMDTENRNIQCPLADIDMPAGVHSYFRGPSEKRYSVGLEINSETPQAAC
jgi:hypothetical protein